MSDNIPGGKAEILQDHHSAASAHTAAHISALDVWHQKLYISVNFWHNKEQ